MSAGILLANFFCFARTVTSVRCLDESILRVAFRLWDWPLSPRAPLGSRVLLPGLPNAAAYSCFDPPSRTPSANRRGHPRGAILVASISWRRVSWARLLSWAMSGWASLLAPEIRLVPNPPTSHREPSNGAVDRSSFSRDRPCSTLPALLILTVVSTRCRAGPLGNNAPPNQALPVALGHHGQIPLERPLSGVAPVPDVQHHLPTDSCGCDQHHPFRPLPPIAWSQQSPQGLVVPRDLDALVHPNFSKSPLGAQPRERPVSLSPQPTSTYCLTCLVCCRLRWARWM